MGYLYLSMSILCEVIATNAIRSTHGFTKMGSSAIVVIGYLLATYFFALATKTLSVGISYAVSAGLVILLVVLWDYFEYQSVLNYPTIVGLALIVTGIALIHSG
jgi:small multidrug resistance pump